MSDATKSLVLTTKLADRPLNAVLLRADVHAFFDDYQWSIWVCRIHSVSHFLIVFTG